MPKLDPQIAAHLEWIGFVRPTGLVVSAPALARAGAILPRDPRENAPPWQLLVCVIERGQDFDRPAAAPTPTDCACPGATARPQP